MQSCFYPKDTIIITTSSLFQIHFKMRKPAVNPEDKISFTPESVCFLKIKIKFVYGNKIINIQEYTE